MAEKQPHILLIMTDQQRNDALGIADHPVLQTPSMDWIGATGTRFRRGYTEAPACIPARRVLMSGQAPSANGMVGMVGGMPWDPPGHAGRRTGQGGLRDPHDRQDPPIPPAPALWI